MWLNEMDWMKNFGRKQVGRKLDVRRKHRSNNCQCNSLNSKQKSRPVILKEINKEHDRVDNFLLITIQKERLSVHNNKNKWPYSFWFKTKKPKSVQFWFKKETKISSVWISPVILKEINKEYDRYFLLITFGPK